MWIFSVVKNSFTNNRTATICLTSAKNFLSITERERICEILITPFCKWETQGPEQGKKLDRQLPQGTRRSTGRAGTQRLLHSPTTTLHSSKRKETPLFPKLSKSKSCHWAHFKERIYCKIKLLHLTRSPECVVIIIAFLRLRFLILEWRLLPIP